MSQPERRYAEETPPGWTRLVEQSWTIEEVSNGLRLFGKCPTCEHQTETRVVLVSLAPGNERKTTDPLKPEPVLVICDCAEEHEGRPAGRSGCGRAGYLELVDE